MWLNGDTFSLCAWMCILGVTIGLIVGFISIIALISGSYVLGILLIVMLFAVLVWYLGKFAMYPGCFFLVKSDIEIRGTSQIITRLQKLIKQLYGFYMLFKANPMQEHKKQLPPFPRVLSHCKQMINMFQPFRTQLCERKKNILSRYSYIVDLLQQQFTQGVSFIEMLENPTCIQEQNIQEVVDKCGEILNSMDEIFHLACSFLGPLKEADPSTYRVVRYKMDEEKLFQVHYAISQWSKHFNYDLFLIDTADGEKIQCAVIHSARGEEAASQEAVLICNPNGAYLQYFGTESNYIKFYLKQGFQIVLWNYRGYGRSTGTPSIASSMKDVNSVYQYAIERMGLDPVVVHGYSIGGCPAIDLAQKKSDAIKLLIADRTFSNIAQMSGVFMNGVEWLTKIIFYSDCVSMERIYLTVRCNKLIIWDSDDQIVADACSLKKALLRRYIKEYGHKEPTSIQSLGDKEDSDEENSFSTSGSSQSSFNPDLIHKFQGALKQFARKIESKEQNSLIEEQLTVSESLETSYKVLLDVFHELDGAGLEIFTTEILSKANTPQFSQAVSSYLMSLAYFGSYKPLHEEIFQRNVVKDQTIEKLKKVISEMKKNSESHETGRLKPLLAIMQVLESVKKFIQHNSWENFSHPQLGIILPTQVGHNGDLRSRELSILGKIIQQSRK